MPLELIRNDITLMHTDAIVNAANSRLKRGGGVCGAIFARADAARLQAACDQIGHVKVGDAAITPSFGLNAPYVIHAVGPLWMGGFHHEEELLRSCYRRSLDIARENGLKSVAFPLISAGIFGYPVRKALTAATETIGQWLLDSEEDMHVYLVLYDQKAFQLGGSLYARIQSYIDEHSAVDYSARIRNAASELDWQRSEMLDADTAASSGEEDDEALELMAPEVCCEEFADSGEDGEASFGVSRSSAASKPSAPRAPFPRSLEELIQQASETFPQMLFRLIDERGLTDPEVYKRANLDRKLFSKIRSNAAYQPGKNTVLALAIALQLNLDQTTDLLRRAGFALSPGCKSDLIVEYFIREGVYSIHEINEALFAFGQKLLGAQ